MPGGDSIDKIIDVEGFSKDLNTVIGGITQLEGKIEEVNTKQITIGIDAKGVENVNALNAALAEQKQLISDLGQVQQGNKQVMAEMNTVTMNYSSSVTKQAEVIANARIELEYVNKSLKEAHADMQAGGADIDMLNAKIVQWTQRQQQLKGEINNASAAIRTSIKATDEFGITMGKTTLNLTNLTTQIGRSIMRFAAYGIVIGGVMKGMELLTEWYGRAAKEAKEYGDALKKIQDATAASALGDKQKASALIAIARDTATAMHLRIDAVKELQDLYPNYFKNLSQEAILTGDITAATDDLTKALLNKSLMEANYEKAKLAAKKYSDLQDQLDNAQFRQRQLAGDALTPASTQNFQQIQQGDVRIKQIKAEMATIEAEINRYDNLGDEFAKKAAGVLVKDDKEKKPKKPKGPNDKGMDAELALAKAQYDEELQLNKQKFENSKQTYADEQNLSRENNVAAYKYGENQINIITAWHGKTGELEKKYLARIEEAHAAIQKEDNKASEEQKAIYDKMVKDYEEFRDKLLKLQELNNELEQIKAGAKASHDRASGASGFLAGLGFDTDFADNQAAKQREIDKAQKDLADLVALRNEEANKAKPDQSKLDSYDMVDIQGAQNNAEKLKADKEAELNEKIFQGKRKLAEKTIELAQTTFEALKTIQDNQFAKEQQQIEIKQQQLQLRTEQELRAIDATAGFQKDKDNQKMKVAAQATAQENALQQQSNALALKKAKADKEAAELKIIASTATAIIETIAAYATIPGGFVIAAELSAVIAGIGAAQYAAAASAPLPQYASGTPTGGTTQRLFIAGEAGPEVINAPGKSPFVVDKPTIFNEPIGTQVIPLDKMYEYAVSNITNNRSYSPELQQAYNNEVIMKEVAKIVGDKLGDVGEDIEKAIYRTGGRKMPNPGASYIQAVRMQDRLNTKY